MPRNERYFRLCNSKYFSYDVNDVEILHVCGKNEGGNMDEPSNRIVRWEKETVIPIWTVLQRTLHEIDGKTQAWISIVIMLKCFSSSYVSNPSASLSLFVFRPYTFKNSIHLLLSKQTTTSIYSILHIL